MKLISWNVNGLRACANKGFMDFLVNSDADIFCAQETKMQREQSVLDFNGYHEYWNSAIKKGYSGTLALTKIEPVSVSYGMGIPEHDAEGRVITLEFGDFFLVNSYTPNSQQELLRLGYRMEWEDAFREYLSALDKKKTVIVCGDLNVAHREIDLKNASRNRRNAGFTDEERAKMTELISAGFTDTFRHLYPDRTGAYTWWSFMGNARANNVGWRIDYFLISERAKDRIIDATIMPEVPGSDHCPVGLELL